MLTPRRALVALTLGLALLAGSLAALVLIGGRGGDATYSFAVDPQALADPERIERGRYLTVAGNCASCHTSPGGEFMAGGVAFHTDFGTLYSTNITADERSGIGAWSAEDFLRSLRHGLRPDGTHLYPAFPYGAYAKLSDDDILAVFAYLKSLPPVERAATENDLAFPFGLRPLLAIWKALYHDSEPFRADPARDSDWNRGAYLVLGLTHCGECHSPRNRLGAVDEDRFLAGGHYFDRVPSGEIRRWSAPNLTPSARGLDTWTNADLTAYLKTGRSRFLETFGPMNEVIVNSTRYLEEADVAAIATYLYSRRPVDEPASDSPDEQLLGLGRTLYNLHCGTCHLPSGAGDPEMAPRIGGGSLVTRAEDPASLINVILYGPELAPLTPPSEWRNPMEAFRFKLDDEEVAALATFVRSSWGNGGGTVTAEQVAKQR